MKKKQKALEKQGKQKKLKGGAKNDWKKAELIWQKNKINKLKKVAELNRKES